MYHNTADADRTNLLQPDNVSSAPTNYVRQTLRCVIAEEMYVPRRNSDTSNARPSILVHSVCFCTGSAHTGPPSATHLAH